MKRAVLFLLLTSCLLITSTGSAEAAEFKRILGPIFSSYSRPWPYPGISADNLSAGGTLNPFKNNRFSFFGGLGLEFSLSRLLEVELEGLYKETGGQYQGETGFFVSYLYEFQIKQIAFPLLLRAHLWQKSRPYFLAGLDFSLILAHRYQLFNRDEGSQIFEKVMEADIKSLTRRTDLALVVGLGFEVAINKRKVAVEGRYELGLPDLYKGPVLTDDGQAGRVGSRQFLLVISYAIE